MICFTQYDLWCVINFSVYFKLLSYLYCKLCPKNRRTAGVALYSLIIVHYRLQTKFAKVLFSIPVCHSVRRGRGRGLLASQHALQVTWLESLHQGGVCIQRGLHSRDLNRGGLHPVGFASSWFCTRGICIRGGYASRGVLDKHLRDTIGYGNEQAVRILLECILVDCCLWQ